MPRLSGWSDEAPKHHANLRISMQSDIISRRALLQGLDEGAPACHGHARTSADPGCFLGHMCELNVHPCLQYKAPGYNGPRYTKARVDPQDLELLVDFVWAGKRC